MVSTTPSRHNMQAMFVWEYRYSAFVGAVAPPFREPPLRVPCKFAQRRGRHVLNQPVSGVIPGRVQHICRDNRGSLSQAKQDPVLDSMLVGWGGGIYPEFQRMSRFTCCRWVPYGETKEYDMIN